MKKRVIKDKKMARYYASIDSEPEPGVEIELNVRDNRDFRYSLARVKLYPASFSDKLLEEIELRIDSGSSPKTLLYLAEFTNNPDSEDSDAFGGGLAFADARVFVSTGFAQVVALDATNGKVLWRTDMPGPMRSAPTGSPRS